jgi:selenocysteine-specific elongation factor
MRERAASLVASGELVECGGSAGSGGRWVSGEHLAKSIQTAERELMGAGALSRAELRSRSRLSSDVFAVVLERMIASGRFETAGESVRMAGRGDDIPDAKRREMEAIEGIYADAGLAAPLLSEVAKQIGAPPAAMREMITLLLRSKRLVRMGSDDAFVHPEALSKLYADLRQHRGESFDVARFKAFTGLTRKHAIPLLEHLDQARVTRNSGGTRIVLQGSLPGDSGSE